MSTASWFKGLITKLTGRAPASGAPEAIDCHSVGELLQHYLDGEIDETRARQITEHLDACRQCGMEADTYERIKATLAARRTTVSVESLARLRDFGQRLARGEGPTAI